MENCNKWENNVAFHLASRQHIPKKQWLCDPNLKVDSFIDRCVGNMKEFSIKDMTVAKIL